eukprot:scaffold251991_cov17-Tisochrysis_lutea.AAC.1
MMLPDCVHMQPGCQHRSAGYCRQHACPLGLPAQERGVRDEDLADIHVQFEWILYLMRMRGVTCFLKETIPCAAPIECDHPPDIDISNNRGQSIRRLVQAALPQESSG